MISDWHLMVRRCWLEGEGHDGHNAWEVIDQHSHVLNEALDTNDLSLIDGLEDEGALFPLTSSAKRQIDPLRIPLSLGSTPLRSLSADPASTRHGA